MKDTTSNERTDRVKSRLRETSTARIVAWVVSVGVHFGIGALAFLITWSVIQTTNEPPPLITATWHDQSSNPSSVLPMASDPVRETALALPPLPDPPKQSMNDGIAVLDHGTQSKIPTFARREEATEAAFMGLEAVSARKIVYVVDASGSMLLHLSTVVKGLEQSLYDLNKQQSFAILFFQKNIVISVPPAKKLMPATRENIKRAMEWINSSDNVIPTGRSNPTNAIASAMRLNPDLVYLLSENIRGAGQYEVSPEKLLASLDAMNPVDMRNSRRRVRINCIEFLTSDPENTMRRIAEEHGGIDGYTFIDHSKVSR
ncbi:MAG: hypothetical protein QF444_02805 [Phycisphaerales bacterium]|nr:hypothetical protein [Phycisphaerales bacterium]